MQGYPVGYLKLLEQQALLFFHGPLLSQGRLDLGLVGRICRPKVPKGRPLRVTFFVHVCLLIRQQAAVKYGTEEEEEEEEEEKKKRTLYAALAVNEVDCAALLALPCCCMNVSYASTSACYVGENKEKKHKGS